MNLYVFMNIFLSTPQPSGNDGKRNKKAATAGAIVKGSGVGAPGDYPSGSKMFFKRHC